MDVRLWQDLTWVQKTIANSIWSHESFEPAQKAFLYYITDDQLAKRRTLLEPEVSSWINDWLKDGAWDLFDVGDDPKFKTHIEDFRQYQAYIEKRYEQEYLSKIERDAQEEGLSVADFKAIKQLNDTAEQELNAAKKLLKHYFKECSDDTWNSDNDAEIDRAIDSLYTAAVATAKAQMIRNS